MSACIFLLSSVPSLCLYLCLQQYPDSSICSFELIHYPLSSKKAFEKEVQEKHYFLLHSISKTHTLALFCSLFSPSCLNLFLHCMTAISSNSQTPQTPPCGAMVAFLSMSGKRGWFIVCVLSAFFFIANITIVTNIRLNLLSPTVYILCRSPSCTHLFVPLIPHHRRSDPSFLSLTLSPFLFLMTLINPPSRYIGVSPKIDVAHLVFFMPFLSVLYYSHRQRPNKRVQLSECPLTTW